MKNFKSILVAAALATSSALSANVAILIDGTSIDDLDFQEYAAANYFISNYPNAEVITTANLEKLNSSDIDCLWIHVDRCGINSGWENLPDAFKSDATINAVSEYVKNGGNLLLTKHATQLISAIGRVDNAFAPGIFSSGEGGNGTDVWTINAQIGWLWSDPNAPEYDLTQFYDKRSHSIYKDIEEGMFGDFRCATFPMEGTANPDQPLWREDHNCMWDLNSYTYSVDGKNTVEKFQNENDAVVLGTWGHVIDFAVAGIVEFNPTQTFKGRIIANGFAACEWAPRSGVNAYHDNLVKLTSNCINYLTTSEKTSIENVAVDSNNADVVYYNMNGMRVDANSLIPGIYVVCKDNKSFKCVVK